MPTELARSIRVAWDRIPAGVPRREIAWGLLRELVPGAVLTNVCPRCGGDHGPVHVVGAEVEASVTYAGDYAFVAVVPRSEASALGMDAELLVDPHRDAVGLQGVLGVGRSATARAWVRVEAALKADGRGLRVDPALVDIAEGPRGGAARIPGRQGLVLIEDLPGPPGFVLSAAFIPPSG